MDFSKLAPLLGRTLVIVAHPDDETITCGGLLQRMRDPCVVFATDGAPEDAYFWSRFGSRERYAAIREQEAQAALAAVGVDNFEFLSKHSESPLVDALLYRPSPAAFPALSKLIESRGPGARRPLLYGCGPRE